MENAPRRRRVSVSELVRCPQRLGRFQIVRRLAYGGMAEILLARSGDRLVVVKTILPWFADHPDIVAMFQDEARLTARLRHPNIVEVFEVGEQDGRPYLAMEYLEGEDVLCLQRKAELRARPLALAESLAIVTRVCAALQFAHRLGVVHCDVSPHNVFITHRGVVKLLDFGIAQTATGGLPADAAAAEEVTISRTDAARGKLAYLSPEQVRCEPVELTSDVFSVSILLWELTTGCRLFERMTEMATMKAIADKDAIRPSVVAGDYPPELEWIVMKGLRRNAAERWQTAEELGSALEEVARTYRLPLAPATLQPLMRELFGAR